MSRGWIFGCAVLVLAGCAHTGGAVARARFSAADYYPLAVGNSWTYQGDLLGAKQTHTVSIDEVKDGYYVDSQGGALMLDPDGLRDHHRYLLKNPVVTGTAWRNVISASSLERWRIVDGDFTCQVPAGRFAHCVRVESTNRTSKAELVDDLTLAPHVGIVEIRTHVHARGHDIPQVHFVLTAYQVAPAAPAHRVAH